MKISILDDYANVVKTLPCYSKLKGHDVAVWNDQTADQDVLAERLKDTEILVLLRERTAIRAPLIARLPKLKLISQRNVYPHIDIDACTRQGILVCSTTPPMTAFHAAAELTWGLIIASMRRIPQEAAALKAGRWQSSAGLDMQGTTLGIFGYGRIGGLMARYAKAFEMKSIAWGRKGSMERARADGVEIAASREALFEQSDVLAVTIRLYPETAGLVTAGRPGTDEADGAVRQHQPRRLGRARRPARGSAQRPSRHGGGRRVRRGAGVWRQRPAGRDGQRRRDPHLGYVTHSNLESYFTYAFDQIVAWEAGKPTNMVNPEAFPRSKT